MDSLNIYFKTRKLDTKMKQLPSPADFWSSLLRERLLLMKGTAEREVVWRDEKLRLLQRRGPALAVWDACLATG